MTKRRSPYPSTPEIKRLIAAAMKSGLQVDGIEVSPDGTVRLLRRAEAKQNSDLFARWEGHL